VCHQNTKYFARLVVVVFRVFAALKFGQTTLLASLAIHLNTLPGYRYSVSLLAVQGKNRVMGYLEPQIHKALDTDKLSVSICGFHSKKLNFSTVKLSVAIAWK
jgi:hypothetical protein